jgi:DNA-directed RNA polymerase specialized sigma24 family protein
MAQTSVASPQNAAESATARTAAGPTDSNPVAERYRASIYRYILRLVRDPERANDLTQETFLRVHQRLEGLKDAAALEAWALPHRDQCLLGPHAPA